MSKKKFNFKNYIKIDGSDPIGSRLMEEHGNIPNEITEKQLDRDRIEEKDVTIEKLLEKNRTGEADMLPEGRLNSETSKLSKYRNSDTFKGDINKIEEWRLANDPVEDEKYSDSSSTPKKLRWWEEKDKSPDGLKLTSNKKQIKTSEYVPNYWDEGVVDENNNEDLEDFEDFEDLEDFEEGEELSFDVDKGLGRINDVWNEEGVEEDISKPVLPEDDFTIVEDTSAPKPENIEDLEDLEEIEDVETFDIVENELSDGEELPVFEEIAFNQGEVGGTNLTSGSVKVNGVIDEDNIARDVSDFLNDTHPDLNITEDSIDLSKLNEGIVSFLVSPQDSLMDIPIDELDGEETLAKSKVVVKTAVKKN